MPGNPPPLCVRLAEPEDFQDIDGHLRGGIPERDLDPLGNHWKIMPGLRAVLFGNSFRPSYAALKLPIAEVKPVIFGHVVGRMAKRGLQLISSFLEANIWLTSGGYLRGVQITTEKVFNQAVLDHALCHTDDGIFL